VYRLRAKKVEQLTRDHTFVQRLIDTGQITPEEAAVHPRRSVLMRVLGDVDASPTIDVDIVPLETDDVFLLCSDGLTGVVSDEDIELVLSKQSAPQTLANELVTRSLAEGAPDNVTVIIARDLETTTAKATKLIGSASGQNPLRSLPSNSTTEIPRAKSLSLPVHTGGLPITQLGGAGFDTAHDSVPSGQVTQTTRARRIALAIILTVIVVAIVAGIIIFNASSQNLGLEPGHVPNIPMAAFPLWRV
jgi:protein phosphatase